MRRTLFYIPNEFFSLTESTGPLGVSIGWLLIAWMVFGVGLMIWLVRRQGWNSETASYIPVLLVVTVAIGWFLPMMQLQAADDTILGLPIRGYGMMVMLGVVAGVSMAAYRARKMGVDPEAIVSLAFWMFLIGIAGARLFYVIQNWPQFAKRPDHDHFDLWSTIKAIASVTEGGLVVYGSLIGALVAAIVFLRRRKLPVLAIGDLIVPSLLIGLSLGRIGCLLNGCCYGGLCQAESSFPAIAFPRDASPAQHKMLSEEARENSPPYARQRQSGLLHGIRIEADANLKPIIAQIDSELLKKAQNNGKTLSQGDTITQINGASVKTIDDVHSVFGGTLERPGIGPEITIETEDGKVAHWTIGKLPDKSQPVHPGQIYSSINAGLLAFFFWIYYPFRRRDGEVIGLLLVIYPITRFLLEVVRADELGRFGTSLTISQLFSIAFVVIGIGLLLFINRQPQGSALPSKPAIA